MAITRRGFLASALAAPLGASTVTDRAFSFALLGDLHYDKIEHHDLAWLDKHHGSDLSQIKNYSRITADLTPRLFDAVRESAKAANASFVLQVGDIVEGLCGSEERSVRQNREALAFIENSKLGVPFVFAKGNHDITGDGAVEAFKEVFHPFLTSQAAALRSAARITSANYAVEHRDALFCFFDAYDKENLDALEAMLAKRTARHCFAIVHPPVVPYGARSTWHVFSLDKDRPKREKLLTMLGKHNAFVLGGHIHRFNTIARNTPGNGRFVQFALSSVVNTAEPRPDTELDGVKDYTPDQVRVEPKHSPDTEAQRRTVYETEAPFVKAFSYADLPGHAIVTVDGDSVRLTMHRGTTQEVYRNVDLAELMRA